MLSTRLNIIKGMIDKGSNVADIGCDHGLLLIELRKENKKIELIGIENKIGPYNTFLNNLKLNKMNDSIEHQLADGLSTLDKKFNTVVIAGMGYPLIKKIILNNLEKLPFIDTFIIDSPNKIDDLRRFFISLGFKIDDEKIIEEHSIFYEIIKFKKGLSSLNEKEFVFGPILLKEKSPIFIKKYQHLLLEKRNILLNNEIDATKRNEIIKEIDYIQEVITNED